jgi:hypothetical protein
MHMSTASVPARRAWLGVISAEHARNAVGQGIIQLNHGKRHGVARLGHGDGFVIYSPSERMGEKTPLRAFTAVGVIDDDEPYLAEPMNMGRHGTVQPWRRRVAYAEAEPVALADITGELELTRKPNWGYALRRGLVELDVADFETIRDSMTGHVQDLA